MTSEPSGSILKNVSMLDVENLSSQFIKQFTGSP